MTTVGAGRYAPSPSGSLHLGNLRTAVVAWLAARSTGRSFLLRVEDLDRARDAGTAAMQMNDLRALGLQWDGDPTFQSTRTELYRAALDTLALGGYVYECYCSRKDVQSAPTAPHHPPGSYPGTCRDLTEQQRASERKRISPRTPALRLRVPSPGEYLEFDDAVHGAVRGIVDDFVLMRGDGTFAYNLAVVVDDGESGVDQVTRGDDLLLSTPRQIMLQRLLGHAEPSYIHVPLVLNAAGKRLAKRDGAVTLEQLAEHRVSATDVLAWIGHSLGLNSLRERPDLQTLLSRFKLTELPKHPCTFDPNSEVNFSFCA